MRVLGHRSIAGLDTRDFSTPILCVKLGCEGGEHGLNRRPELAVDDDRAGFHGVPLDASEIFIGFHRNELTSEPRDFPVERKIKVGQTFAVTTDQRAGAHDDRVPLHQVDVVRCGRDDSCDGSVSRMRECTGLRRRC